MSDTPAAGAGFGAVEAALLREVGGAAPSIANSQPWRFAVGADRVEVWTDPERSLPAVDPDGRQRLISCGTAILNLRLAVAHLGFDPLLRLRHRGVRVQAPRFGTQGPPDADLDADRRWMARGRGACQHESLSRRFSTSRTKKPAP